MPAPRFRSVGPTVQRQGRVGDPVQSPIWSDLAAAHDDQTSVVANRVPNPRVGPFALRRAWLRGPSVAIWDDRAPQQNTGFVFPTYPVAIARSNGPTVFRFPRHAYLFQTEQAPARNTEFVFPQYPPSFANGPPVLGLRRPFRTSLPWFSTSFPTQYAGLRYFSGTTRELCLVAIADAPVGMGAVWKIRKGGVDYAVYLVETNDANASGVRVQTSAGTKAARLKT